MLTSTPCSCCGLPEEVPGECPRPTRGDEQNGPVVRRTSACEGKIRVSRTVSLLKGARELGAPRARPLRLALLERAVRALDDEPLRLGDAGVAPRLEQREDLRRSLAERARAPGCRRRRSPRCPRGSSSSQVRSRGQERSGAGPLPGLWRMPSRIFWDESLKPNTGAPATTRSAPAASAAAGLVGAQRPGARAEALGHRPGHLRRVAPQGLVDHDRVHLPPFLPGAPSAPGNAAPDAPCYDAGAASPPSRRG